MNRLNIVITAGGTSEYIDKVRKITNSGSGKLGSIIANKLAERDDIDTIFYIHTPKAILPNLGVINTSSNAKIKTLEVVDTISLKNMVEQVLTLNRIDYFIHSMAVSDYTVNYVSTIDKISNELKNSLDIKESLINLEDILDNTSKISSSEDNLVIVLKQAPKIINLIKKISPETHLIGFKLLEDVSKEELINVGYNLLIKNNCDYVVANDLKEIKEGNHRAYVIDKNKNYKELIDKNNIASYLNHIII